MANPAAKFNIEANDKTKMAFRTVQDRMSKFDKHVRKLKGAMFALGGAAGFGYVIKRSLDTADALAKSADAAGISTTTLQELRFAAKQSGVEISDLDTSVGRFTRRLGLAADGTGPAVKAFEALNLGIKNTDGSLRNTEVILGEAINKLAAMDNQARRSALASQLFGDESGPRLSVLLAQGTEGIVKLRKEAHKLGLVLDEEAVRAAEKANDQLEILNQKLSTGMTSSVIENSEAIEDMADALIRLTDWAGKATGKVVEFTKWISEELAVAIDGIGGHDLPRLQEKLQSINEELNTIGNNKFEFSDLWTSDATKKALEEEKQMLLDRIELAKRFQSQKKEQTRVEQQLASATQMSGGNRGGSEIVTPEDEKRQEEVNKQREALNRKFENLRQHLVSSQQLENEAYARSQEILLERREAGLLKEQEYQVYQEELERQHQSKLNAIKYQGMSAANKFAKAFRDNDVRNALAAGAEMTAGVAQTNKTLFDINKGFALANAAVTLPDAVLQSFRNGGGYPWGLVPAGLMLAKGLAQIQAINSANFTGKGGSQGSAPSLSGSGGGSSTVNTVPGRGASNLPDIGNLDSSQSRGVSNFYITSERGASFSSDAVEAMLDGIEDAIERGDRVIISRNSRQGLELKE